MKVRFAGWALLVTVLLSACAAGPKSVPNETLTRYGAAGVWMLTESHGQPVTIDLRLGFPSHNIIWAEGPCNSFSGLVTAPYPWFAIGPMKQSGRSCALLDAERAYMTQLTLMTQAKVLGNALILSNQRGDKMMFRRL